LTALCKTRSNANENNRRTLTEFANVRAGFAQRGQRMWRGAVRFDSGHPRFAEGERTDFRRVRANSSAFYNSLFERHMRRETTSMFIFVKSIRYEFARCGEPGPGLTELPQAGTCCASGEATCSQALRHHELTRSLRTFRHRPAKASVRWTG
jgi:hypothetical protein